MSDDGQNYLEIRVYLIGDYYVGKKAIVKRFKVLNSTSTTEEKEPEKKKEKNTAQEGKKAKPPEEEDKKQLSEEEIEEIRKENQRQQLMQFTKTFVIGMNNISLNFFPIKEAEPLGYDHEAREEDEDFEFEKDYKISLKLTKKEIETFILRPAKNQKSQVEHLFLFCFDLKDYSTFEKVQIYFSEINKHFNISSNYQMALIGNKLDQKIAMTQEEKESFDSFILKTGMKYYEISTLMFFNFENFFENLFKDLIVPSNAELQDENFINRFHLFLTLKPNFPKAKRSAFTFNDNPGPGQYDSNIYEYSHSKEEFKKAFDNNKGRFKTKIFINKEGPLFPLLNKEKEAQLNKESIKKSQNKKIEGGTFQSTNVWENQVKKELKEALEMNVPGYSLGIRTGRLNLKQSRRIQKLRQNIRLSEAFEEDDMKLHIKSSPVIRDKSHYEKYDIARRENYEAKLNEMKRIEAEIREQHEKNKEKHENERQRKIKQIEEKEEKYNLIYQEKERERSENHQKSSSQTHRALKPLFSTPGPNAYDIRGNIDTRKGFTFGSRYYINKDKLKNEPEPQFPNISSEFDEIVKRASKSRGKKAFAERFFTPKAIQPGDPSQIYEKLKKWEQNRENSLRASNLMAFLNERKQQQERVAMNKEQIEQEKEEEFKALVNRQFEKGDTKSNFLIRNINYNQVEENSPKFSIKGRYEHGGIFQSQTKVGDNNSLNSNNLSYQLNSEANINTLPVPKFNIGKPSLPSFSFGKAKRFDETYPIDGYTTANTNEMIFSEGQFKPEDTKSYQTKEVFMGTAKKSTVEKDNGVPGPGYYRIKGFAEEVAEKGAIVNEVRTKIREKEKNMTTEKTAAKEDNTKDSKEQKEGDEYNDFESNVDHLDNQSKTSSQKEEVKVEQ